MTEEIRPTKATRGRASSLYRRIEADMRERIEDARWPHGTMLPGRKALADEYGVDLRTIQRAIASLLADGTLRAEGGRGTFVASNSSNPRTAHLNAVALILDQSFRAMDSGAQAIPRSVYHTFRNREAAPHLITFDTHGETIEQIVELERHALEVVERDQIAGVILGHTGGAQTLPLIQRLRDKQIPIVFLDRYPTGFDCDFVGVDNTYGGQQATECLLELGHQNIAFLASTEEISPIEQRFIGYQKAMQAAGLSIANLVHRLPYSQSLNLSHLKEQIAKTVDLWISREYPPTAVFAVNDFLAHYFIAAAEERGWSIPHQISVIGFDDIERFSPRPPFLTTMQQPFDTLGERAAELLLSRLSSPQTAYQHILLPTKLIVRSSCLPPPPLKGIGAS